MILPVFVAILLIPTSQQAASSGLQCPEGRDNCSTCYKELVSKILENDENLFEVQQTFFPPLSSSPSFVTVHYLFPDDRQQVWFWSQSYFYLLHPLHVFQFTSLLFSDYNLLSSELRLNLPSDCFVASSKYFALLTQRVSTPSSSSYFLDKKVNSKITAKTCANYSLPFFLHPKLGNI